MNWTNYYSAIILLVLSMIHSGIVKGQGKEKLIDIDFQELLPGKLNRANIIEEEDYNVWGTNIVKDKYGKYHAIYSRWLKSRGFDAWVTHSEIAHAVSDHLTGPYTFCNIVLPSRGNNYWDGDMTHNPHLIEYLGKYYLYYTGNHGSGYWCNTPDTVMPKSSNPEWWVNRNNQRIGVAVATDLNGEWKRFEKPLINIGKGRKMVATPVVSIRPDGKFLMVYKYVIEDCTQWGGKVIHMTALSDSPLGPFVDTEIPFIIAEGEAKFAIDDHVQWYQGGRYYCIGKDHDHIFSREYPKGSMLLWVSDSDGLNWTMASKPLVFKAGEINWTDGTTTLCKRTCDMPKVYMEDGKIKALIMATLPAGSEVSFSTIVPLKDY